MQLFELCYNNTVLAFKHNKAFSHDQASFCTNLKGKACLTWTAEYFTEAASLIAYTISTPLQYQPSLCYLQLQGQIYIIKTVTF